MLIVFQLYLFDFFSILVILELNKVAFVLQGGQSSVSDSDGAVSASDRTGGQVCDEEEKLEQKSDPVPLGPYQPNNPVGKKGAAVL